MLDTLGSPGNDNVKNIADIRHAIDRALAADDGNPKALMIKAIDRVGIIDGIASLKVSPLGHFEEFEKLAEQANSSRPTDCGCEAIIYSQVLGGMGRFGTAMPLMRKVIANDPSDNYTRAALVFALSGLGRDSDAGQVLDDARKDWPDSTPLNNAALILAVERQDWVAAKKAFAAAKFGHKDQAEPLLNALASGNRSQIDSLVAPIFATDPRSINWQIFVLLAASGHDPQTANLLRADAKISSVFPLAIAWTRSFKGVRATPEFAALMKDLNLPAYWRQSGHRPDVCQGAAPEPFCAMI